jgi:hypothetical protein
MSVAKWLPRTLAAGALTAVSDGLFSSSLSAFAYGSTVERLFQGVASVLIGPDAFSGGWRTALLGVLMHVFVAMAWSALFVLWAHHSGWLRRLADSPFGVLKVASFYGPAIWLVMSLIVIPVFTRRPPAIGFRWAVQLLGHAVFVGLPIAAVGRGRREAGS